MSTDETVPRESGTDPEAAGARAPDTTGAATSDDGTEGTSRGTGGEGGGAPVPDGSAERTPATEGARGAEGPVFEEARARDTGRGPGTAAPAPPWPPPPPPFTPPPPRPPLPDAQVWLSPAAMGTGAVALALATFDRPGVGVVITGALAASVAITALVTRPRAPERSGATEGIEPPQEPSGAEGPDRRRRGWSAVYGGLAAVLLATAALRDAGWVLAWTLTAAFLLASLAFSVHNPASRGSASGVVAGATALVRDAVAAPRFLVRPLVRFRSSNRLLVPALATVGATLVLLVVFGGLFALADPVFAKHLERLFVAPDVRLGWLHPASALATVLLTGSAVLAARRRPRPVAPPLARRTEEPDERSAWPVWVWAVPLGSLAALFSAFLGVQATAMFGGDDYVQRVAGVIYAEYARQGFFQLVMVGLLVLGVVALTVRLVPAPRIPRNALLGVLCLLTLVILASAMARLQLYIDVFGLTRLRVAAEAWIVWIALLFGLIMVAGLLNCLGRPTRWLPRATVALGAAALAVFAYSDPDLRIAESHHDLDLQSVDTRYLRGLSADAVPGLLELDGPDRTCALELIDARLRDAEEVGARNLSRERARDLLAEHGPLDPVSADGDRPACWVPDRG
ncbi:DUF4153 domain-containing protein [Nocardiopsis sp. NPDC006938]|uniref:DUF4153 domain-containing protein n=1 Tax=Nocardiopsis sp. NPDC006938 TaxID=3364337 RepID=UPI0036D18316